MKCALNSKNEKSRIPPRVAPKRPDPCAWTSKFTDGMMFVCKSDTYDECIRVSRFFCGDFFCAKCTQLFPHGLYFF